MTFLYEQRESDSPFIERVWRSRDAADGYYLAAADYRWRLQIVTKASGVYVWIRRPSRWAVPIEYMKGNTNLGIIFRPGVFLTDYAVSKLPTFDNAEEFVASLAQNGLIAGDETVRRVLSDTTVTTTTRTVQRHFAAAIGLPLQQIYSLQRAHQAVALLQQNKTIIEAASWLGYTDQAHLTRYVKQVSGCTPGQIVQKVAKAQRLNSIQNYGVCAAMGVLNFRGCSQSLAGN